MNRSAPSAASWIPPAEVVAPGVIPNIAPRSSDSPSANPTAPTPDRILALRDALVSAGFDAPIREDIRWNIWLKLWGNVCFNPISALTLATLDRVTSEPGLRELCTTMMTEARAVASSLGVDIPEEMMARRLNAAGSVVGHKISMPQDLERGRSLEIDALGPPVHKMGRLVRVATPTIDAVLALGIRNVAGRLDSTAIMPSANQQAPYWRVARWPILHFQTKYRCRGASRRGLLSSRQVRTRRADLPHPALQLMGS